MIKPYYEEPGIIIYHGDCRDILPHLEPVDLVLTDPPWGLKTKCSARRFTRRSSPWWLNVNTEKIIDHDDITNDDKEFDPSPYIKYKAILWGANNYANRLPNASGWLVWDKRKGIEDMAEKGWPLGEAELAWTNIMGHVRVFRNLWSGLLRVSERGEFYHPTQKPIELMKWCIAFVPNQGIVFDPYMGAGSTLIAAKDLGRKAIGIEIEEKYCEIAVRRLKQEILPLNMRGDD